MKSFSEAIRDNLVIIRGAGDLATGVAIRLFRSGFPVIMLETEKPTVIRRTVSFAQAVFDGECRVEGICAVLTDPKYALAESESGCIPVVCDPEGKLIRKLKPRVVVDAILAKKNLGTTKDMAPFVVALGPGFTAGEDCHAVVETKRGHNLGRVIFKGSAEPNTGIPGIIGGYGKERVMKSPCAGLFRSVARIGDIVEPDTIVAYVGDSPVITTIGGKVRGMLMDRMYVPEGFKVADVDPRGESTDHTTCSDKAMAIGGGVLEAIMNNLSCGD
ncbi:MAG: EF2563 family selenium-dependent molybdenum hydroxylase system protein [Sphaerochaetaceae bacterium]|nr:EF2563 family selenium-dependent molybdenum hydroxylase system protein [Sphaerochaetaceae bacterium]